MLPGMTYAHKQGSTHIEGKHELNISLLVFVWMVGSYQRGWLWKVVERSLWWCGLLALLTGMMVPQPLSMPSTLLCAVARHPLCVLS